MPSASSKSEKPPTPVALDPLQQAIIIIEHKIRNLEKRRSKLESYKGSEKYLSKDQIEAVSRYDEVVHHLELSKEYVKQFKVISTENDKLKKKLARRDARDKYASHKIKVKQVLQIQNVLQGMSNAKVREDFLTGQNGAVQLTENDLKTLSDLYIEISSRHSSEDDTTVYNDQFQKAAELYLAIIEGKSKEIVGSSGAKLKELFASVHACGYFNQLSKSDINSTVSVANSDNKAPEGEKFHKNQEILSNVIVPNQNSQEGNIPPIANTAPVPQMIPGGPILPAGTQPQLIQPNQQPILPPNVTNIVPTPVSQVESSFFNAQGLKPPAPPNVIPPPSQNSRQINDVIQSVAGKFNFLQESELDLAEINPGVVSGNPPMAAPSIPGVGPSSIPTQTFTNQNFNGPPGGTPTYPPNYPPQPATFQNFVPAFPAFVPPNAPSVENTNNANSAIPASVASVNSSVNSNIPSSNSNINNSNNKCNNIPNPIPMAQNRNPGVNFSQSQQQMSSVYPNHQNSQTMPQPPKQPGFQHGNMTLGSIETPKIDDTVRTESEVKEKPVPEKQDWSQTESTHWADEWTETSEWNPPNQNHSDGTSSSNKFSSGRVNRNGVPRSTNGYQGNKNRSTRPGGGYRESQANQGPSSGSSNYYQNQNDYQSRNDRNYDFPMTGKGNSDFRDGRFRDRGDFNARDRDNYGGSFKRGPVNRGTNMRSPADRNDKQEPIQRNNPGGPRGPRNLNRQPGGRNGSSFPRQQPNTVGQPTNK